MLNAARWAVAGLLALSIIVLAFAIGYVIADGGDSDEPTTASQDERPSGDEPADIDFDTLNEMVELLQDRYINPDLIDEETLYQAAINGMLQTLSDSGTFYVDPITIATSEGPSGTFEGIGASVSTEEGRIIITAPIEDTPASRAGIRAGDQILEVDGESTEGWSTEKAVLRIRGPKGTTVTLLIRHEDGSEETYELTRDEIEVASVTTTPPGGVLEDGAGNQITDVGYIYIREFNQPTLDEFRDAMDEVIASGARGLVLDMRNNPGGLLSTTVEIADEFLDEGIILSERERNGDESSFSASEGGVATEIPVVVLLNRFSASGSEVLGAALQENGRATIVGETSFGKGTVNIASDLSDGGQMYVSVAQWLTPNGTVIDRVGIRPDVPVALSDEDVDLRRDTQLFKALDILRGTAFTPEAALTPQPQATPLATPTTTGG
jgi:carboxyl-terminal processing protease